jgi:DNA-binding HxlR family transcriptional regulator
MKRYGQYCPVSRAAEILAERWTVLVIRELLSGSDRFNSIARGVPRMSPSLLSTRLRELQRAGLVTRHEVDGETRYRLTAAGRELQPIVEQFGNWGQRWMREIRADEYDPALLMLDISREVRRDRGRLPARPTTVQLELSEVPARYRSWWLVFSTGGFDVCDTDPGHPVRAWVNTDPVTLTRVWLGQVSWTRALRADTLRIRGDREVCRLVPGWIGVSRFAAVEPGPEPLPR